MTRDEVFAAITALGATKAVLEFHGGHDEGFVDNCLLYNHDTLLTEEAPDDLVEALEAPIYDKYYGFDGDFDVFGTLTWNVTERKLKLAGSETEWVGFEEDIPEPAPEENS